MRPPTMTTQRPLQATLLLVLLLLVAMAEVGGATSGVHGGRRGRNHHHHKQHHDEHRAPRTRREQDQPEEATTRSSDGLTSTEAPDDHIPCTSPEDCQVLVNSVCDTSLSLCTCPIAYPLRDDENAHCLKEAQLNQTCQFSSQCRVNDDQSVCKETRGGVKMCICQKGYKMAELPNIGLNCANAVPKNKVDPAMVGVLAGLALMFVIICVVLRLFSKARFRENRSIFNTPNPRLMNASLFKDIDVTERRRGSTMSAVSATGSASAASPATQQTQQQTPASAKSTDTPSKDKNETTVAIETVD